MAVTYAVKSCRSGLGAGISVSVQIEQLYRPMLNEEVRMNYGSSTVDKIIIASGLHMRRVCIHPMAVLF